MTPQEIGTAEQRRSTDEITWPHVWLTNVLIGADGPSLGENFSP